MVQYAKDHYDLVEINPAATNWIERQKNLKASLIKMCIRDRARRKAVQNEYLNSQVVAAAYEKSSIILPDNPVIL